MSDRSRRARWREAITGGPLEAQRALGPKMLPARLPIEPLPWERYRLRANVRGHAVWLDAATQTVHADGPLTTAELFHAMAEIISELSSLGLSAPPIDRHS